MGVAGVIPQELTTARVNGHPVAVHQAHRRWTTADYVVGAPPSEQHEPVLVTVSAPVHLSVEDVAAVLFDWGLPEEELCDDLVRLLVAEAVLNWGGMRVEGLRCDLGEAALDAEQAAYLACCRDRAVAVFGTGTAGSPGSARVLVGVR